MSKIYHFDELEDFYGEGDWKLQIDVTDLWNMYNEQKLDLLSFSKNYYNRLIKYKNDISNVGEDVWDNLQPILKKMNERKEEKELLPVFEDVYDWADKNDILIKTK
jgi:hypothetical protein